MDSNALIKISQADIFELGSMVDMLHDYIKKEGTGEGSERTCDVEADFANPILQLVKIQKYEIDKSFERDKNE